MTNSTTSAVISLREQPQLCSQFVLLLCTYVDEIKQCVKYMQIRNHFNVKSIQMLDLKVNTSTSYLRNTGLSTYL